MGKHCNLRAAGGEDGVPCEEETCVFWRVAEHIEAAPGTGCAIEYFELLGDHEKVAWLLTVKERVERLDGSER